MWEYLICYSFDRGSSAESWTLQVCGTQNRYSLANLGKEGWQLASIAHNGERWIFKREVKR